MHVLTNTTELIGFADTEVTAFLPGFGASLNGTAVNTHIDTGGTYLHMGVHRAQEFGIELAKAGKGKHGANEVDLYSGIAKTFDLGPVRMENVPVVALPSLIDQQDFVIFGTSILQQFLPSIDYVNQVLILRPRNSDAKKSADFQAYSESAVEMPFRMLGDHYMIATGGIGNQRNLNFFIDSGLVSLHRDGEGTVRQAAFIAAKDDLESWGVDLSNRLSSGAFELSQELSLGRLAQGGHLILAPARPILSSMDGVAIHGLLSHAFLKRYAWTIDFDAGIYYFRE